MNIYEKIHCKYKQYNYQRKRNKKRSDNNLDLEKYIEEMDIYIGDVINNIVEDLDELMPK